MSLPTNLNEFISWKYANTTEPETETETILKESWDYQTQRIDGLRDLLIEAQHTIDYLTRSQVPGFPSHKDIAVLTIKKIKRFLELNK